ncbi:hypothetical protein [Vibrio sp. MMH1-50]|uniref:hypothetical protein n=1 Tax=Vibrio sp. MMH1-50 TaxID=2917764 RepID=UPI001EF329F2|nr:hypothetical protein [Vibrio sp. MMH1-50]MCG7514169.1 hypothetical protein [Vibrio sp. MMH1-50]
MKRQYILVGLSVILSGCASQQLVVPTASKVIIVGDTLVYDGVISGGDVLKAIRLVKSSDKKIKKLRITSPGGEIDTGIEFGYFVKENNLDVEVSRLCFSACANYVLTAANSITIKKDALIGWHGGALQSDELWKQTIPNGYWNQYEGYLNHLRVKEKAYFNYINVDPYITVYGQIRDRSCQKNKLTEGWYYSLNDLKQMGVKNVDLQGGKLMNSVEYENSDITSCLMPDVYINKMAPSSSSSSSSSS